MKDVVKTSVKKTAATRPGTKHRRRRNMSLYYLMIFIICILVLFVLSRTVLFNINEYIIRGNERYSDEEILSAAGLKIGKNMYNLNLDSLEERVMDEYIYVDDIEMKRSLPDKLIINVTEAVEYACCEYENRYCVISAGGRYLETEQRYQREGMMLVKGMELKNVSLGLPLASKDDMKLTIVLNMFEAIDEICPGKITLFDITDRTNIKLVYDNRIEVEFGSSLDYEYKLKYITAIIEENLNQEETGKLIYHSAQAGASFISTEDLEKIEQEAQKKEEVTTSQSTDTPI